MKFLQVTWLPWHAGVGRDGALHEEDQAGQHRSPHHVGHSLGWGHGGPWGLSCPLSESSPPCIQIVSPFTYFWGLSPTYRWGLSLSDPNPISYWLHRQYLTGIPCSNSLSTPHQPIDMTVAGTVWAFHLCWQLPQPWGGLLHPTCFSVLGTGLLPCAVGFTS